VNRFLSKQYGKISVEEPGRPDNDAFVAVFFPSGFGSSGPSWTRRLEVTFCDFKRGTPRVGAVGNELRIYDDGRTGRATPGRKHQIFRRAPPCDRRMFERLAVIAQRMMPGRPQIRRVENGFRVEWFRHAPPGAESGVSCTQWQGHFNLGQPIQSALLSRCFPSFEEDRRRYPPRWRAASNHASAGE